MLLRSTSPLFFALGCSLIFAPAIVSRGQATPPASSNTAPVAPAAPATAPTPADTTAATTERPTTYTMVAGDSLDSIARKFDTSIHALAKLNKIPHAEFRKLRAGKVLQIPPAPTEPAAK